jgi:predicted NUDIX family NTP pyrophosphohydrolase
VHQVQQTGGRVGLVREGVLDPGFDVPKQAAGILLYRQTAGGVDVLLAHPGGPLWARKDLGAWTIPKGQFGDDESPLDAARREFEEEMGSPAAGEFVELGSIRQPSGKTVHVFTAEADFDVMAVKSNLFTLEWPPKSGKKVEFPEVDRAEWFALEEARRRILKGQEPFLDRLLTLLTAGA